jgi:hypothetical protein
MDWIDPSIQEDKSMMSMHILAFFIAPYIHETSNKGDEGCVLWSMKWE